MKKQTGTTDLETALHLAVNWHSNLYSSRGRPYILHCIRIMEKMETEETRIIALLHDILEDTKCTEKELQDLFSETVVDAVVLLTKLPKRSYQRYIRKLALNPRAREVKIGDLLDNMRIERLAKFEEKEKKRMTRYYWALNYLVNYPDSAAEFYLEEEDE